MVFGTSKGQWLNGRVRSSDFTRYAGGIATAAHRLAGRQFIAWQAGFGASGGCARVHAAPTAANCPTASARGRCRRAGCRPPRLLRRGGRPVAADRLRPDPLDLGQDRASGRPARSVPNPPRAARPRRAQSSTPGISALWTVWLAPIKTPSNISACPPKVFLDRSSSHHPANSRRRRPPGRRPAPNARGPVPGVPRSRVGRRPSKLRRSRRSLAPARTPQPRPVLPGAVQAGGAPRPSSRTQY